jgi:hypothetical protein
MTAWTEVAKCERQLRSDAARTVIFSPNAHAQARKNQVMLDLAKMAENFRMQF